MGNTAGKGENNVESRNGEARELNVPECFTKGEVKQMMAYFRRFSREKTRKDENDYVQVSDMDRVPALSLNPMVTRVSEIVFDESQRDDLRPNEVDFEIFLQIVSVFHPATPETLKQQYAFKAFDNDDDGEISADDLIYALSCIFPGLAMSELQVQADFLLDASPSLPSNPSALPAPGPSGPSGPSNRENRENPENSGNSENMRNAQSGENAAGEQEQNGRSGGGGGGAQGARRQQRQRLGPKEFAAVFDYSGFARAFTVAL